jgi:hypothetical protein
MDFITALSILLGFLILFRSLYLPENHAVFQLAMQHKIASSQTTSQISVKAVCSSKLESS